MKTVRVVAAVIKAVNENGERVLSYGIPHTKMIDFTEDLLKK